MQIAFRFILVFGFYFSLSAQKLEYTLPTTREIVVYNNDLKIVAHVLITEPEKKFKINPTLYYQWFKEDIILQTKGGYKGNLLHGVFQESYPNKQLKQKGIFANGVKNGVWTSWYDNGEIQEIAEWKNGKMNGKYEAFSDKGEVLQIAYYDNGLLDGWKEVYSNGKIISKTKFKNGVELPAKKSIFDKTIIQSNPIERKSSPNKEKQLNKNKTEPKHQPESPKKNSKTKA